jgi:MFS family permease
VTGIQGAITAYTLVMAALMITGAKVGAMIGRKRAFAVGCVIYGCGSFTTAIAPILPAVVLREPLEDRQVSAQGRGPFGGDPEHIHEASVEVRLRSRIVRLG